MSALHPTTEGELAEVIRDATGPVQVIGGGTRAVGQIARGTALHCGGLRGVRLYEPGALTLVVGAGTPLREVTELLASEGQRLAFEPPLLGTVLDRDGDSTIGGVVASNASGPRRVQVGACRDHLLGVRFVDGQGRVVKNGGRVMKNVTGYDLVKLMAGSWGTLGVLNEVSLKVLPAPEMTRSLVIDAPSVAEAISVMQAAMGTPYEVSAAASYGGKVMLRLEGFEVQLAHRTAELAARFGASEAPVDWDEIRDAVPMAAAPVLWRVSLRPSRMAAFLEQVGARDVLLDWGGGLAWLGLPGADPAQARLHAAAAQAGGHATLIKAPAGAAPGPVFQPEAPAVQALSAGLRARFDPRGLLNPGRMG